MNAIRRFEKQVGGRWTGITFHRDGVPDGGEAKQPINFCEAIKASSTGPIVLTKALMNCPGALRSFGWSTAKDEQLTARMAALNGIEESKAQHLINEVPRIEEPLTAITVGDYHSPDVMLSYAQPESAMRLIYGWQGLTGSTFNVTLSSVMATCGWVCAASHVKQAFSLSFGCPEFRKTCAIGNDRLIVGLPAKLAKKIGR